MKKEIPGFFDYAEYYKSICERFVKGSPVLVEVGVFQGKSALFLASNSVPSAKIHLVDDFRRSDVHSCIENLRNVTAKLIFHIKDSSFAAQDLPDESCDFVYLDADHSYDGLSRDIDAWLPKVKKGGILAGHDYAHPRYEVKKVVNERFPNAKIFGTVWEYENI